MASTLNENNFNMQYKIPSEPTEVAIRKLHRRQSYVARAPYQRKSKRQAIGDAALKCCPATWLGPAIIKAHELYEYRKDRRAKEKVYNEYWGKRRVSKSIRESSIDDLAFLSPCRKETIGWSPLAVDPLKQTDDPWLLPPVGQLASLDTSATGRTTSF